MPPVSRPWFRFYVGAMRDPKIARLSPAHRWLWVSCLAAARESRRPGYLMVSEDVPMQVNDLAKYADMRRRDVEQAIGHLAKLNLLARDKEAGAWAIPAWKERQYESDTSTERVRKHRLM